MDEFLHGVLFIATLEMVLALGLILSVRAKHRRTTGKVRFVHRKRRALLAVALPLLALLLACTLITGAPHAALVVRLVLATGVCIWLRPRAGDEVYGSSGVQRGWRSRRFEQLEEWRLTGDHLRFRIGGEWLAVGVPVAEQSAARELLQARCAERESRFSR
jgi:hypothetical protein